MSKTRIVLLLAVMASAEGAPLFAQAPQQPVPPPQQAAPAQAAPEAPAFPSDRRIAMMIFSTLIALNQANATGNYSVLRDMGSPGFQSNSVARIAEAFANLRQRNLDLSPILLFQPKLLRKPEINKEGMLRVTGFFNTQPERVLFDLLFESVGDQWKLFGISVDANQAPPPDTAPTGTPPAQAAPNKPEPQAQVVSPSPPTGPVPKEQARPDLRDRVQNLEVTPTPQADSEPSYNPLSPF
jgi:hypothetical protein